MIICSECNSIVRTGFVKGSTNKNTCYRAWCKCSSTQARSEKRALKAFKHHNETTEQGVNDEEII